MVHQTTSFLWDLHWKTWRLTEPGELCLCMRTVLMLQRRRIWWLGPAPCAYPCVPWFIWSSSLLPVALGLVIKTQKNISCTALLYTSVSSFPGVDWQMAHKEEEKSSNPQGTIEEERDERDRSGGEGEAEWRESSWNKRETGYIQKAQHNMYLTWLVRVGWVNLTGIDLYFHTAAKKHASHETIIKPSFSGLI